MTVEKVRTVQEQQERWEKKEVARMAYELLLTSAGIGVADDILKENAIFWGGTKLGYLTRVYVAVLERAVVLDLKKGELKGFFDSQTAARLWSKAVVERARSSLLEDSAGSRVKADQFHQKIFEKVEAEILSGGRVCQPIMESEPNILFGLGRVLRTILEKEGSIRFTQTEEEIVERIKSALKDDEVKQLQEELVFPRKGVSK